MGTILFLLLLVLPQSFSIHWCPAKINAKLLMIKSIIHVGNCLFPFANNPILG
jgi:hypothetical protein